MAIDLTCSCGRRLQVADAFAGRQGQCPACGALLPIPGPAETETVAAPAADHPEEKVSTAPEPYRPASLEPVRVGADEPAQEGDREQLTAAGCVVTLLSFVVILVAAVPIVRWRGPDDQPLPRYIAIVSPLLVGAVANGIGLLVLRVLGIKVWKKPQQD